MPDVLPVGVQNELHRGKPEMRKEITLKKGAEAMTAGGSPLAVLCAYCHAG